MWLVGRKGLFGLLYSRGCDEFWQIEKSRLQTVKRTKRISAVLLLATLILIGGVPPAKAQHKEDLYNLATAAALAGRVEESVKLYCQVAHMDTSYKDSKRMCAVMTLEKQKEQKKNEERFTAAIQDFNGRKYDEAEQKFKNIRFGPRFEEAQQYLKVKIPEARQEAPNRSKENERK